MPVCVGQLLLAVAARRAGLDLAAFGARLARMIALGAEAPAVRVGNEVALLVEEVDMVDLLDRPAGKARLMLDDVLEPRLGRDDVVASDVLVPGPVCARPHSVDAGQPADITGHDAAGGKQEARQRDDPAMAGLRGIVGIAPERIVVADAMRIVADIVPRRLVTPGLGGHAYGDADALAQLVEALFGDLRESALGGVQHATFLPLIRCFLLFDGVLAIAQHLAVD